MKNLMNLVMAIMMALLACSCGNNGRQQGENDYENYEIVEEAEEYFSYQVLIGSFIEKEYFGGLAILHGDDNSSDYILFDDEEDYYNDYIYEWALALKVAYNLYYSGIHDSKQINACLKTVHCLPNCLDAYGIMDGKVRETILKSYYDLQDVAFYEPDRRYGIRSYPVDKFGYGINRVVLFRIEDQYESIPLGVLGIK